MARSDPQAANPQFGALDPAAIKKHARAQRQVVLIDSMVSDYRPDIIWNGILHGQGKRIIEAGIYLLLFTPIMRVFASCILFAFQERDRLYTVITLVVLILTLAGLLWIG